MEMLILACVGAYLIGSIPFGLILTRLAGLGDIRQIGSGNIGATNVLRTGKKWLALVTLVLDFGKGVISSAIGAYIIMIQHHESIMQIEMTHALDYDLRRWITLGCFVFPIIGHMFPVWLKFKGGKGVAVCFGVLFANASMPYAPTFITAAVIWLLMFFLSRYSSLAALAMVWSAPLSYYFFSNLAYYWPALFTVILLVSWAHRDNIRRLIKGEEHRFSFDKKERSK